MLEWKPKLVALIVLLVVIAAVMGLGLLHVTQAVSVDPTVYNW
ncbi:MAG TPA: hypothetical protein VMJ49_09660 [Gaiellaceae bacterium]|nr:hypothetical protein [Gaiellaceae bacterium]HTZ06849.1 hypothetical protein [Gaiellaceae bacterium]